MPSRALLHLPPDIDDFTGRQTQADEVARLITARPAGSGTAVPVATIFGKGGVGKTALVLHVAHRIRAQFPDGQIYTNLRGVEADRRDPAEVLAGFLRELGVDGTDVPEHVEERARMYRARLAGQRILVVLDNAAEETQIRPLLPGSPDCAVLVTSRSRMAALAGSHTVPLDLMPSDQSVDLITRILGRTRAEAEPEAVAEIAELCGFLPLAIRIAGARLASRPAWRISWFAERLRDERRRLDLLKVGDLDVRASFALSYDSRSDAEQRAFRMLGVLKTGDFPAWNLAALIDAEADEAEQLLEQLVDAELIEMADVDRAGLIRYRFHDLLRDFAREKLTETESAQAQRDGVSRLAEEYIGMARTGSMLIQPGALQDTTSATQPMAYNVVSGDPRNWFIAERASLVSVVHLAHDAGLWDQTLRLVELLPAMFDWRADWQDWDVTHTLGLEAAQNAGSELGEAVIRCSLGMLYRELGRYDEAVAMLTQSSEIFLRLGDEHRWATTMRNLGDTHRYKGLLDEAINCFDTALTVFGRFGDQRSSAGALNGMADAYRGLSQWRNAAIRFDRCIAIYRELDDRLEQARSTVRRALVLRDQNLNEQAKDMFNNGLDVFRELGDRRWEARTLRHLGVVNRNQGNIETALALFGECMPLFEQLADRRGIAVTLRNRGDAYRWAESHGPATEDLKDALARFESIGDHRWAARTRLSMADLLRRQQRWDEALSRVQAALGVFQEIPDRPAEARALRELGMLLRDQGDLDEAHEALTRSRALFEELSDNLWVARVIASQAELLERRGDDPEPMRIEADEICRRNGILALSDIAIALKEW